MFGSSNDRAIKVVVTKMKFVSVGDSFAASPAVDEFTCSNFVAQSLRFAFVLRVVTALTSRASRLLSCSLVLRASSSSPVSDG